MDTIVTVLFWVDLMICFAFAVGLILILIDEAEHALHEHDDASANDIDFI